MDLQRFSAHLAELRAAGRWTVAARLVSGALDLLPHGARFETRSKRGGVAIHTKDTGRGLEWHCLATSERRLMAGPRRGQMITEASQSWGGSWGYGVGVGLGNDGDPALIEIVWRSLRDNDQLPSEGQAPATSEPLQGPSHGHNGGPPLDDGARFLGPPCPASNGTGQLAFDFTVRPGRSL
jgi:hypothetical protein